MTKAPPSRHPVRIFRVCIMEEERLWKFKRPEWLNSVWARNSGVYAAGGLVRHGHVL